MDQPNKYLKTTSKILLIGNFDGVHRGHQELIQQAIKTARACDGSVLILTFDPHPTKVLAPDRASPLLTTLERKRELLLEAGVNRVIVQSFGALFANKSPREFVQDVIAPLGIQQIFVGQDFCFGHKRAGTYETLRELGKEFGYTVEATPLLENGGAVSSSRIRQALSEGDVALAAQLLGRPFDFDGLVIQGDQRGRTIGFPTANLVTHTEAIPKNGVYAVRVTWQNDASPQTPFGIMNIGTRPTIEQSGSPKRSIEVHLLDFSGDIYGKTLRIECIQRLRDEQKFENLEALKAQIRHDADQARSLFAV